MSDVNILDEQRKLLAQNNVLRINPRFSDPLALKSFLDAQPEGPDMAAKKLIGSAAYSSQLGLDPEFVFNNWDMVTASNSRDGLPVSPEKAANVIAENWKSRSVSAQMDRLYDDVRKLKDEQAQWSRSVATAQSWMGKPSNTKPTEDAYQKHIDKKLAEIESLQVTFQPPKDTEGAEWWGDTALGIAQSMAETINTPETAAVMAGSLIVGGIDGKFAGTALQAGKNAVSYAAKQMGWGLSAAMARQQSGSTYKTLLESGISHEVASPVAGAVGILTGLMERAQFNTLTGLTDGALIQTVKKAVEQGTKKVMTGNGLAVLGRTFATRVAMNTLEETGIEVLQEATAILGEAIADEIDKSGGPEDKMTMYKALDRLLETAKTAGAGMLVISAPGAAVGTIRDARTASKAGKAALEAINQTPNMSPEVRQAAIDEMLSADSRLTAFLERQATEPSAFSREGQAETFYHGAAEGGRPVMYRSPQDAALKMDDLVQASPDAIQDAVRNKYGQAAAEWIGSVFQGQELLTDAAKAQIGDQINALREAAQNAKQGAYDFRAMTEQARDTIESLGVNFTGKQLVATHLDVAPGRTWTGTAEEFQALQNPEQYDAFDLGDKVILNPGSQAIIAAGAVDAGQVRIPTRNGRIVTIQEPGKIIAVDPSTKAPIAEATLEQDGALSRITSLPENPVHARQMLRAMKDQGTEYMLDLPQAQIDEILATDPGYRNTQGMIADIAAQKSAISAQHRQIIETGIMDQQTLEYLEAVTADLERVEAQAFASMEEYRQQLLGEYDPIHTLQPEQVQERAKEHTQQNREAWDDLETKIISAAPQLSNVAAAMVKLMEVAANAQGLTLAQWRTTYLTPQAIIQGDASGNRAAVQFMADGRAMVTLTTKSDPTSFIHELGHIVRRQLASKDQAALLQHYQSESWTVDAEEQFAADWERYFMEGRAPSAELAGIFQRIARFFRMVYGYLRGAVDPEVRAVIDRALTDAQPGAVQQAEAMELYQPRDMITKIRGQWTKPKIEKELKKALNNANGTYATAQVIARYDSPQDLLDHTYFHGTTAYTGGTLKPSMAFTERQAETMGGGGYGDRYWAISVSKSKRIAENFSGDKAFVSVYPVLLSKDAKVIEMPEVKDAADLEDHIENLWNDEVDAVWIGGGEQELAVLNPYAITTYSKPDNYKVFGGNKSEDFNLERAKATYNQAQEVLRQGREGSAATRILFQPSKFEQDLLSKEIDLGIKGVLNLGSDIHFGRASEALKLAGLPDVEVVMPLSKLLDGMKDQTNKHGHNLTKENYLQLQNDIYDPAYIFVSETVPGAYVVVSDSRDASGDYIIAAIKPSENRKNEANVITSVYGKSNLARMVKSAFENNLVLYRGTAKEKALQQTIGLQLPEVERKAQYKYKTDLDIYQEKKLFQPEYAMPSETKAIMEQIDALEAEGKTATPERQAEIGRQLAPLYKAVGSAIDLWLYSLEQAMNAGETIPTSAIVEAAKYGATWAQDEIDFRRTMDIDEPDPAAPIEPQEDRPPRTRKEAEKAFLDRLNTDADDILKRVRDVVRSWKDIGATGWVPDEIEQAQLAGMRRLLTGPLYSYVNAKDPNAKRRGSDKTVREIAIQSLKNNPSTSMELAAYADGDLSLVAEYDEIERREPLAETEEAMAQAERDRVKALDFQARVDRLRGILGKSFAKATAEDIEAAYAETSLELRRLTSQYKSEVAAHEALDRRYTSLGRVYEKNLVRLKEIARELDVSKKRAETLDRNATADIQALKNRRDQLKDEIRALKTGIKEYQKEAAYRLRWNTAEWKQRMDMALQKLKAQQERRDELRKAREYKQALIKQIKRPVSKGVDYEYAKQIYAIQDMLNPQRRNSAMPKALQWYAEHPAFIKAIVETMGREPDVQTVPERPAIEQLEDMLEQIIALEIEGKAKRDLYLASEAQKVGLAQAALSKALAENFPNISGSMKTTGDKPGIIQQGFQALEEIQHVMDQLDGANLDYNGPFWRNIYKPFAEASSKATAETQRRAATVKRLMDQYGIKEGELYNMLTVDGKPFELRGEKTKGRGKKKRIADTTENLTHNTAMGVYMAIQNDQSRAAVTYGNKLTEQEQEAIVQALPQKFKDFADALTTEVFDSDYDRLAQVHNRVNNKEMGRVDRYYPMMRQQTGGAQFEEELAWEAMARAGVKRSPKDGMTKGRVMIGDAMQTPIRLDALGVTMQAVDQQERFIAYAELSKRIGRILNSRSHAGKPITDVLDTVRPGTTRQIKDWAARVVNGDQARSDALRLMLSLKRGMSTYAMGFNLKSAINNLSGLPLYLGESGPHELLKSAVMTPAQFAKAKARMIELAPEMNQRAIDLADKMASTHKNRIGYEIAKFPEYAFWLMKTIVHSMDTIGWTAVYNAKKAQGMSDQDAATQASAAVLRTQPSGDPLAKSAMEYDPLGAIITPFASQAYKVWNQLSHLPDWKKKDAVARYVFKWIGVGMGTAMFYGLVGSVTGAVKAMAGEGDEPEKVNVALELIKAALSTGVPLVGSPAVAMIEGYGTNSPIETQLSIFNALRKVLSDDRLTEKESAYIMDQLGKSAASAGLPYVQLSRIMKALTDGDASYLKRVIHALVGGEL